MQDHVVPPGICAGLNRLHEATAIGLAIAGVVVDMAAMQAVGAMIGVSVTGHRFAAREAIEIFDSSLELFLITHDALSKRGPALSGSVLTQLPA